MFVNCAISQGWPNRGRLVAPTKNFCTVAPNVLSIVIAVLFLAYKHVYQLTRTAQKAPDNSDSQVTAELWALGMLLAFLSPFSA